MCGIAGKITSTSSPTHADLRAMLNALKHRGPDDEGIEIIGNAGLGQRRLAIIDLSPGGHQPMSAARGRYWITFNGEIYNYLELKDQLRRKKHHFHSNSDTEVILAAYEEWGVQCVKHFNGMFAFALYDRKTQTLFAARDRLGEKPFKYFFDGKTFLFASELKAILTQPEVTRRIDTNALRQYIYWGFVPSPHTGFQDIRKLPAAHYLVYANGKVQVKRYWDVTPSVNTERTEQETIETLRELITDSVRLRMISDVPIGAFLSGGIDSCVVTGLMSRLSSTPIRTFTIGFDGFGDNEAPLARISSAFHGTTHQELIVKPNIKRAIAAITTAYDEPFGDGSAIPSYYVSQITRKHVTVALNGDGGDENFCGYSNYTTLQTQQRLAPLRPLFAISHHALQALHPSENSNPLLIRLTRINDLLKDTPLQGYARHVRSYLNLIPFESLFKDHPISPLEEFSRFLPKQETSLLSAVTYEDFQNVLPDGLMTKMDIASMQHALETRAPLLDPRLVEFAATIPAHMKVRSGTTKWIFKQAFHDLIPEEILAQPKRGFIMPVNEWFHTTLHPTLQSTLADPHASIYTLLNFEVVDRMRRAHLDGKIDYSAFLWRFMMLELWLREYGSK